MKLISWEDLNVLIKEGFFIGVVYKYTNKENQDCYIGKTINPEQRKKAHISASFNERDPSYDSHFHRAVRKYGLDAFDYEVLLESNSDQLLLEKEAEFIQELKEEGSILYNMTDGGEGPSWSRERREELSKVSRFKNAKLTEDEVIEIRKAYERGESPSEVWKRFPQITHQNSFLNIWCGTRYAYVMPEVFTSNSRSPRLKLTRDIAEQIRNDYQTTSTTYSELALKYKVSKSTISDVIKRRTFK